MKFTLAAIAACTGLALRSTPTLADDAAEESTTMKPIGDLSTRDTLALLHSWNLDSAFAEGFEANQYDGMILEELLDLNFPEELSHVHEQFPKANLLQWRKLQKLLTKLMQVDGGTVDVAALPHDALGGDTDTTGARGTNGSTDGIGVDARGRRQLTAGNSWMGSGIHIKRDAASIALGVDADVVLTRAGDGSLVLEADTLNITANNVTFAAGNSFVANDTDLLECCRSSQANAAELYRDIVGINEQLFILEKRLNESCVSRDEAAYDCDWLTKGWTGSYECIEDIVAYEEIWTDRTYEFKTTPDDMLDTYHTYTQVRTCACTHPFAYRFGRRAFTRTRTRFYDELEGKHTCMHTKSSSMP